MTAENNKSIEFFLKNASQYLVLHESSPTKNNLEHYFISIMKLDINDDLLNQAILNYKNEYPLIDISQKSIKYIKSKENNYHFIFIDTLDKNDRFFLQKDEFLRKNIHNILSIRILGKAVNLSSYLDDHANKYISQLSQISENVKEKFKGEIKTGVNKSLNNLNEKAPIIKEKFEILKKKIIKPK